MATAGDYCDPISGGAGKRGKLWAFVPLIAFDRPLNETYLVLLVLIGPDLVHQIGEITLFEGKCRGPLASFASRMFVCSACAAGGAVQPRRP